MKARIKFLTPEMEKAVRKQVEDQTSQERGWNAHCVVLMALWVMHMEYGWGEKRLARLYHQMMDAFVELTKEYGTDCWYDKILADLERAGVQVKKDAKDLEREEHIRLANQRKALSPGQQAALMAMHKEVTGK